MPTLSEIRSALENEARYWRARIEALEVQLSLGRAEAADRFEAAKHDLGTALDRFEGELRQGRVAAGQAQQDLATRIGELRAQLALGRAETREALEAQQARIRAALDELERRMGAAAGITGETVGDAARALAEAVAWLDVEREALQIRLDLEQKKGAAALEDARRALATHAAAARASLQDMERESGERVAAFRKGLTAAWEDLRRAFRDLRG